MQRQGVLAAGLLFAASLGLPGAFAQVSTIPVTAQYACDFENGYCDFVEQSKLASSGGRRSSFVPFFTSGNAGVRLHTESGDSNVSGSGTWERNDLRKPADASYCQEGDEEWWAFSVMFPTDYVFPPGPEAGIIMDFHHTGSSGQANWEIQTIPNIGLRARGYGGSAVNGGKYEAVIPDPYGAVKNVAKNVWYNFVVHVRWSSSGNGLMEGWLNGKKFQSYSGATLYSGMTCYLKLANYHAPFGQASSVIFDRVVRGSSSSDVTLGALEGVSAPAPAPTAPASYRLSTIGTGTGTGTISSSPSGIYCGSTCSSTFASGATVTLSAAPTAGSAFTGWSGACSGTGSCTVTMNGDKSVTATFASSSSTSPSSRGVVQSATSLGGFATTRMQSVTYTNQTGSKVTFIQAYMSSARFTQTNNCGEVANGASCTATISYYPTNSGSDTGTLTLTSTAPNSPHVVSLSASAATGGTSPASGGLSNISTRAQVLTGDNVMIGGFIISGTVSKTVAITATGPSLVAHGITNPLANPKLTLVRSSDGAVIATNDNWGTGPNAAQLQATGFAPSNPLESAIYINLLPGAYTAIVSGADGGTGVGLIGVFQMDRPEAPLINLSTRGLVSTGNDVLIGGFVVEGGAKTVLVRARGPSLAAAGITNALGNPVLQIVRSSDGVVVATNDNWGTAANAAQVQAMGLAPGSSLEPAILINLNPGAYTAIVSGAGGTVGVGSVELFVP